MQTTHLGSLPKVALLLPSYRRFWNLFYTISRTILSPRYKFIVTANYCSVQLWVLKIVFKDKAIFIDERPYGKGGMVKAYNTAYDFARSSGYEYVALWADDILPQKTSWCTLVDKWFIMPGHSFGIFSTDECHKRRFGWNFFDGIPNAHFFIARTAVLGKFFLNPELNAYVGDYEVCVRMVKNGTVMTLLPVRLDHNHTNNPTRRKNSKYYKIDIGIFNRLHPEKAGVMDDVVLQGDYSSNGTFVVDTGDVLQVSESLPYMSYSDFLKAG